MGDEAKVQNSKLTPEQKKLINTALSGNITRFREYRLNSTQEPEINPKTGKPKKRDSLKPDGAIFFEYLAYNSFRMFIEEPTSNGFFYHSYQRIEEEYGIGKDRVQKITAYLKDIGVVETKVCGFPKNTHYRIRFDKLGTVEVAIRLYKTHPDRTREIVAHYAEMAKAVKLREETSQETLDKRYPFAAKWYHSLKKIYYEELKRFNKTLPRGVILRKPLTPPSEENYRNIESRLNQLMDEWGEHSGPLLTIAFRLFCAMVFFYKSDEPSTSEDLRDLITMYPDCADYIVNYQFRLPIAYFFTHHADRPNHVYETFLEAAPKIDPEADYFCS